MKYYMTLLLMVTFANSYSQQVITNDSVSVRIYNKGKFYIKTYSIVLGNKKYTFSDIWKHKYSDYQKIPYLSTLNQIEVTTVHKRFMRYDAWQSMKEMPIDHVGEKKITSGKVTINVLIKNNDGKLEVKSMVVK